MTVAAFGLPLSSASDQITMDSGGQSLALRPRQYSRLSPSSGESHRNAPLRWRVRMGMPWRDEDGGEAPGAETRDVQTQQQIRRPARRDQFLFRNRRQDHRRPWGLPCALRSALGDVDGEGTPWPSNNASTDRR